MLVTLMWTLCFRVHKCPNNTVEAEFVRIVVGRSGNSVWNFFLQACPSLFLITIYSSAFLKVFIH
jgi:hypothetical protein